MSKVEEIAIRIVREYETMPKNTHYILPATLRAEIEMLAKALGKPEQRKML